ncbi:MAG: HEAT repeat domain-containing protein, partial [Kamptonema sp. SIO4C4]|nr:HEAT repeat domain-containing protein [Kamptonema sp. SIO4C4]
MSDLNSYIQAVQAASSPVSLIKAVRQLAQLQNPDAIPMLIEVLGYNNPGAAIAAVEGLVKLGDVAVPVLLENIDGYDYGARAWANRALAEIGHPHALDNLLEAASSDFALSVRRAATKGLGSLQWSKL